MVRSGAALADNPKGADTSGNRRHRRRRHDLIAGTARRSAQLGLPVLLAAGRDADLVRADELGVLRRGGGLARLAAARGRGSTVAAADHVRDRRRTAASRIRGALAAG